ncbi:WhiB family transcriptional regulator [Nocardia sp. CC201C]|uniref:WhiB family transcriptional regulator n=1 Tax=Nocardia sp. CC201C TaxID=3044575 RepID=UPI0024A8FECF|nr:WhiB family transcriptional regulator [Nocardia sp. CC201C]
MTPDREILIDWHELAACAGRSDIDRWHSQTATSSAAAAAKRVCVNDCPVREACGRDAVRVGDSTGIRAGFHTGSRAEWKELHRWLGLPVPGRSRRVDQDACVRVVCSCGDEFEVTAQSVARKCPPCRNDLVDVTATRTRVREVYAERGSLRATAQRLGITTEMVKSIMTSRTHVKRRTAEKVLGTRIEVHA